MSPELRKRPGLEAVERTTMLSITPIEPTSGLRAALRAELQAAHDAAHPNAKATIRSGAVAAARLPRANLVAHRVNADLDPAGRDIVMKHVDALLRGFEHAVGCLVDELGGAPAKHGGSHPAEVRSVADPGSAGAIDVRTSAYIGLTVADAAETSTLADPVFVGQTLILYVVALAGTGTRAITAASAVDDEGNDVITFDAEGQIVFLKAVAVGAGFRWEETETVGAATITGA